MIQAPGFKGWGSTQTLDLEKMSGGSYHCATASNILTKSRFLKSQRPTKSDHLFGRVNGPLAGRLPVDQFEALVFDRSHRVCERIR